MSLFSANVNILSLHNIFRKAISTTLAEMPDLSLLWKLRKTLMTAKKPVSIQKTVAAEKTVSAKKTESAEIDTSSRTIIGSSEFRSH